MKQFFNRRESYWGTILALLLSIVCQAQNDTVSIMVYPDQIIAHSSDDLYGSNIEDVNHEIYGGFYDQKIFGESFEEPVTRIDYQKWEKFSGFWHVSENGDAVEIIDGENTVRMLGFKGKVGIGVTPNGPKLINKMALGPKGGVSTNIKFVKPANSNEEMAGVLIGVSDAAIGADNFNGYEISLDRDGKYISLSEHHYNYNPIKRIKVDFHPTDWNHLDVRYDKNNLLIYLNDKKVLDYDLIKPILGKVGFRSWRTSVQYQNIRINNSNEEYNVEPILSKDTQVSYNWSPINSQSAKGMFYVDSTDTSHGKTAQVMQFVQGNGRIGITNSGLNRWGISVRKGNVYTGNILLKEQKFKGKVYIALESADGKKTYALDSITDISKKWLDYSFSLKSGHTDSNAQFTVYIQEAGKIWCDRVSLFSPEIERFKNLPVRKDIAQAFIDQGLKFMRYAGTMTNNPNYRIMNMIGKNTHREPYLGHWNKYSTNGFGILEFLQFCEDAGFKSVFAINMEESPEDVSNFIQYLNGHKSSPYGAKRVEDGHPESYKVKYVELGNEEVLFDGDNEEAYKHYIDRFKILAEAIHKIDPDIHLINAAWWRPGSDNMKKVFNSLDGIADFWDLHIGADSPNSGQENYEIIREMKDKMLKWNSNTNMKIAIFEENGSLHNMQRALGHATNLNALRKFGDFILTSTPANALQPYRQNDNDWDQGQIFFTSDTIWKQPPYYVQKMASTYHQPDVIATNVESPYESNIDVSATVDADRKRVILHLVNTGYDTKPIKVGFQNLNIKNGIKLISLKGDFLDQANYIDKGMPVQPEERFYSGYDGIYSIPGFSYNILVFDYTD